MCSETNTKKTTTMDKMKPDQPKKPEPTDHEDEPELANLPSLKMHERAFRAVRRRALTVFEEFEEDSSVTVKFVRRDDRLWAIVRCDDDRIPTVIWNQDVIEFGHVVDYEIMEMWMDEKLRDAFLEFCTPDAKADPSP